MADHTFKIPRASDRVIADWHEKLSDNYGLNPAIVNTIAFGRITNIASEEGSAAWQKLLSHDSCLINTMSFSIGGLAITYQRGGTPEQNKGRSPIYDEISFSWNPNQNQNPNDEDRLNIVAITNNSLNQFDPGRTVHGTLSEEQTQLLAIHQSTLARLEQLNEELVRGSAEFRKGLEDTFQKKVQNSEKDYTKKQELLQAEKLALEERIAGREQNLATKLKEIDDRDNTHVRREIRDKMLEDVKQRISQFGVSQSTEDKRRPVLLGIMLLISSFFGLFVWSANEIRIADSHLDSMVNAVKSLSSPIQISDATKDTIITTANNLVNDHARVYWLWARLTIYSFGLLGSILYYIKWQNKWAEQHISSEFQLQQFYLDVNRANWVIESALEWRKNTQTVIPKVLLTSITNGLFFNNQTDPERVVHPADALASALLGTASKLKLKVGDSVLEFDKPGKIPNKPTKVEGKDDAD